LATLAWAWHPSKVEAVAWISGRTDLMCALGVLLCCAGVRRRLSGARGAGSVIEITGAFVALASKEHGIVVPAFIAIEAWSQGGRRRLDRDELVRLLRCVAPYAALVAAYLALRTALYPIAPERVGSLTFLDARLYTLETMGEFVRIVLFPLHSTMQHAPIRVDASFHVIHDPARIAIGAGSLLALGAALWAWQRRGATWRTAGALLGLAALAPVANLAAAKMVFLFAERFAYIPLMGFALCLVPRRNATLEVGEVTTMLRRWKRTVPAAALLLACAVASVLHAHDFLDDRHLWEHELAENPEQPLALRLACQEAMHRQHYREALALALRGYVAAEGWPVAQPDRVEFALRAARSVETLTLDAKRVALQQIFDFYDVFLGSKGTVRLDVEPVHVAIDARGSEAYNFRRRDPKRLEQVRLWRAIVASRIGRCDVAVDGARGYLAQTEVPSGQVDAILVLGRCGQLDDALAAAKALDFAQPAIAELTHNLAWIKGTEGRLTDDIDGALARARVQTLLLDRGGAYRALEPWRDAILAEDQGAMFFARTAWAAGHDDAARAALEGRTAPAEADALLRTWSRELGRDP
jgi:hypothetical protein